jgi:hypothetical protein
VSRLAGDAVALLEGELSAAALLWMDILLGGFGTRVIFGDDFKKPACWGSVKPSFWILSVLVDVT